jgi:hypothetical protein
VVAIESTGQIVLSTILFISKYHLFMSSSRKRPQPQLFDDAPVPARPVTPPASESDHVFDLADVLTAPLLTFSVSWADTIPERLLRIIPLARMMALKKEERLATYAECCCFIYTRTLEAPLHGEWADIYTHVSCKTLEDWFGEDRWAEVMAPRELSEWHRHLLDQLRRHIYEKRRAILKKEFRTARAEEKSGAVSPEKKSPLPVQQSLFEL